MCPRLKVLRIPPLCLVKLHLLSPILPSSSMLCENLVLPAPWHYGILEQVFGAPKTEYRDAENLPLQLVHKQGHLRCEMIVLHRQLCCHRADQSPSCWAAGLPAPL